MIVLKDERGNLHEKDEEIAEFAVDYYQRMVTAEHRMQCRSRRKSGQGEYSKKILKGG